MGRDNGRFARQMWANRPRPMELLLMAILVMVASIVTGMSVTALALTFVAFMLIVTARMAAKDLRAVHPPPEAGEPDED